MTHHSRSATVIAIGNQKGGSGKSTITVHLAAALGRIGRSCLIIDLDPAAGTTKHLGISPEAFAGTLELLTSDEPIDILVVTKGLPDGVTLVPSRPQLSELELALPPAVDRTQLLARGIEEARPLYDYILLDTSPYAAFATTVGLWIGQRKQPTECPAHPEVFLDNPGCEPDLRRSGEKEIGAVTRRKAGDFIHRDQRPFPNRRSPQPGEPHPSSSRRRISRLGPGCAVGPA